MQLVSKLIALKVTKLRTTYLTSVRSYCGLRAQMILELLGNHFLMDILRGYPVFVHQGR